MDNLLENYFPATIESAEAMVKFGQTIAIHLRPGDVLALIGNLGAGKTHLTQAHSLGSLPFRKTFRTSRYWLGRVLRKKFHYHCRMGRSFS